MRDYRLLTLIIVIGIGWAPVPVNGQGTRTAQRGFWTPDVLPHAEYAVTCKINPERATLSGTETIRLNNGSSNAIRRLVLRWPVAYRHQWNLEIAVAGEPVTVIDNSGPVIFDLPEPLQPGESLTIDVIFSLSGWPTLRSKRGDEVVTSTFLPRLWWGVTPPDDRWGMVLHDDYDVTLNVPPGYAVAASGRFDPATGSYRAKNVRTFGIYLGKGHQVLEAEVGHVLVRCVCRSEGVPCAKLLLAVATDVIEYYRDRFGLYPYQVLNIVPGMERPAGGYPVATNIIVIHGQEQFKPGPDLHWRWITAHEIGHQYWGDYVLEKDTPGWLWIGLGLYADREYCRARGLGLRKHHGVMKRYLDGASRGFDTTLAITPEQLERISFDWHYVVKHGKGYGVVSALACYLGKDVFDRAYLRALQEFAGRRLGLQEFQDLCEKESGQDLGWFFDQWARSNRYLLYEITDQKSEKEGDRFISHVTIQRAGTLAMPVPVVATFEDGMQQWRITERLLDLNVLTFESRSPLKDVQIDPDGELPMLESPPLSTAVRPVLSQLP